MSEMKVILKIHHTKLVMDLEPALEMLKMLWSQNVQEFSMDYTKDEVSGNYAYVNKIKTMEPNEMSLEYISPTNYIGYCLNGDTK
jgi:hypothetical protein